MENASWFLIIMGLVFVLIAFAAVFSIRVWRMRKEAYEETGQYPKGHYLGMGIAIGIPLGFAIMLPVGIAMDDITFGITLGPAIGTALGVAIGSSWEQKHEGELRPLTERELRTKRKGMLLLVGIVLLGVLAMLAVLLSSR